MLFWVAKVLDMDHIDCLIEWAHNFLVNESYTQVQYLSFFSPIIAFHIEITPLADGTYELIQDSDGDFSEAQANIIELTEAPNFDSENPKSTESIDINTGKPRQRDPTILNYAIQYYLWCI